MQSDSLMPFSEVLATDLLRVRAQHFGWEIAGVSDGKVMLRRVIDGQESLKIVPLREERPPLHRVVNF